MPPCSSSIWNSQHASSLRQDIIKQNRSKVFFCKQSLLGKNLIFLANNDGSTWCYMQKKWASFFCANYFIIKCLTSIIVKKAFIFVTYCSKLENIGKFCEEGLLSLKISPISYWVCTWIDTLIQCMFVCVLNDHFQVLIHEMSLHKCWDLPIQSYEKFSKLKKKTRLEFSWHHAKQFWAGHSMYHSSSKMYPHNQK